MRIMRIVMQNDPFAGLGESVLDRGTWPAVWIGHLEHCGGEPVVLAMRRQFSLDQRLSVRICVSADERYQLFLDGQRIGLGPQRGDPHNWFFETYDLDLPEGSHVLVALVWWIGMNAYAPTAQMTVEPAFLLATTTAGADFLNTGTDWECKRLHGYTFDSSLLFGDVGAKLHIDGRQLDWGFQAGGGQDCASPAL